MSGWQEIPRKGYREWHLRNVAGRIVKVRELGDEVHVVMPNGFVKVQPGWTVDEAKAYAEGLT